jgi:putative PEP-CTERM system TPR-repeat lipoprotein
MADPAKQTVRTRWLALMLTGAFGLGLAACSNDTAQSLTESGKGYAAKKDYKAAAIQFKSALQRDPQATEARLLLGEALMNSGDMAGAVVELSKSLDQQVASERVLPALSKALLMSGDTKKLTDVYGSVQLSDKHALAALKSNLAAAWSAQGNRSQSEAAIAAALAADPDYAPARLLNARLIAGRGDPQAALAQIEAILAKEPDRYEGWQLKGEILQHVKSDLPHAEEAYRKAVEIEKSYVPAYLALIRNRLEAKDLPGAKKLAEALRAVMPKHPQMIFVDAEIAYVDRDAKTARELSQQLLRLAPQHLGVLQLAGAIESEWGSPVVAEIHYSKALLIQPDLPDVRQGLANTYLRLGQPAKALATLKPALDSDVPNAPLQALAGEAYSMLGDQISAEQAYLRAAKIDPNDNRTTTALAVLRLSGRDAQTALADLQSLARQSKDTYADSALISANLRRNDLEGAMAAVDAMAKKLPDDARVQELRGRVLVARTDYPAARAAFEQALRLDPSLFAATSSLAALDVLDTKPEQARKRFEDSVKADPRNFYAQMALAALRERDGAPLEEVKQILADAIKHSPGQADPRLQLIDLTLRKRQYKEALSVAQEAAAALSNDTRVLDAVGRAQMQAGSPDQAITTFRQLAGLDPNASLPYARLADVYAMLGKRESIEASLGKALELEPNQPRLQQALVDFLISSKRPDAAVEFARKLQVRSPKEPGGYMLEGLAQMRMQAPDAAVAAYRKGIAAAPEGNDMPRQLYLALMVAKKSAEADKFAAGWLKAHPKDLGLQYQLSLAESARGDFDAAEARLRHIVNEQPNNALVINNLAMLLMSRNKPGSLNLARKANEIMPANPALIDTLAAAEALEGQFDKALADQKRAVALAPEENVLRLNLARIAAQAGDKALARKEIERLEALGAAFAQQGDVAKLKGSL